MENLREKAKEIFEQTGMKEIWENSKEDEFELQDNDLYFFDPKNDTGISLGRMGDGWVCIFEKFV
jgi:hypothetical protein